MVTTSHGKGIAISDCHDKVDLVLDVPTELKYLKMDAGELRKAWKEVEGSGRSDAGLYHTIASFTKNLPAKETKRIVNALASFGEFVEKLTLERFNLLTEKSPAHPALFVDFVRGLCAVSLKNGAPVPHESYADYSAVVQKLGLRELYPIMDGWTRGDRFIDWAAVREVSVNGAGYSRAFAALVGKYGGVREQQVKDKAEILFTPFLSQKNGNKALKTLGVFISNLSVSPNSELVKLICNLRDKTSVQGFIQTIKCLDGLCLRSKSPVNEKFKDSVEFLATILPLDPKLLKPLQRLLHCMPDFVEKPDRDFVAKLVKASYGQVTSKVKAYPGLLNNLAKLFEEAGWPDRAEMRAIEKVIEKYPGKNASRFTKLLYNLYPDEGTKLFLDSDEITAGGKLFETLASKGDLESLKVVIKTFSPFGTETSVEKIKCLADFAGIPALKPAIGEMCKFLNNISEITDGKSDAVNHLCETFPAITGDILRQLTSDTFADHLPTEGSIRAFRHAAGRAFNAGIIENPLECLRFITKVSKEPFSWDLSGSALLYAVSDIINYAALEKIPVKSVKYRVKDT
jgi:hypothetical protein